MPAKTPPTYVLVAALRDLWAKFDNPSVDRRGVDLNASFDQEITDIAIGQRETAISVNRHQYDLFGKSMPFERIAR